VAIWTIEIRRGARSKTNKKPDSQYQKKDDIGQFPDHLVYLIKKYPGETFFQAIVGRTLPVSNESNPPDDLRVVPLESFHELLGRVEQMYNFIESSTDSDPVAVKAERWLQALGLSWPQCFDSLPFKMATDLKKVDAAWREIERHLSIHRTSIPRHTRSRFSRWRT